MAFINALRNEAGQKEVMIEFLDGAYRRAYKISDDLVA